MHLHNNGYLDWYFINFRTVNLIFIALYVARNDHLLFNDLLAYSESWILRRSCESCLYKSLLGINHLEPTFIIESVYKLYETQAERNGFTFIEPVVYLKSVDHNANIPPYNRLTIEHLGNHLFINFDTRNYPVHMTLKLLDVGFWDVFLNIEGFHAVNLIVDGFYKHLKLLRRKRSSCGLKFWLMDHFGERLEIEASMLTWFTDICAGLDVFDRQAPQFYNLSLYIKKWLMTFRIDDNLMNFDRKEDGDIFTRMMNYMATKSMNLLDGRRVVKLWNRFTVSKDTFSMLFTMRSCDLL